MKARNEMCMEKTKESKVRTLCVTSLQKTSFVKDVIVGILDFVNQAIPVITIHGSCNTKAGMGDA